MNEFQLQRFWLNHAARLKNLHTNTGATLSILYPGQINLDQGPDFLYASIKIDDTIWVGSIEIHCKTSDWYVHRHHEDNHYHNVILHVVWKNDQNKYSQSHLLVLSDYVEECSIEEESIVKPIQPLMGKLVSLSSNELTEWGLQRLERKANEILTDVKLFQGDWNYVCFRKIFAAFGVPLNGEVFQKTIDSIYPYIKNCKSSQMDNLRILLLGQSGFFSYLSEKDIDQFNHLKSVFELKTPFLQFLTSSMRPNSFPERRMEQFVECVFLFQDVFRNLLENESIVSSWIKSMKKDLGHQSFEKIIINVFAPMLIAYAKYTGIIRFRKNALQWIHSVPMEKNKYSREYLSVNKVQVTALQTQGMIEFLFIHMNPFYQLKFT